MNYLMINSGGIVLDLDQVSHSETKCTNGVLIMDLELESTGTYLRMTGNEARQAYRALFGAQAPVPDGNEEEAFTMISDHGMDFFSHVPVPLN